MSLKKRILSFKYAFRGIATLFRDQPNARIHLAATVFALTTGFYLNISPNEWCIIILLIATVLSAEALNSAIEMIADKVSPQYNPLIKKAKDLGAAAVLFLACTALIIAAIIFIPKIR
ncbi:MAG: diacylglycerol kinase family protein [Prevotella sp.]|nr:diacylglycerol kinase family protein [Bacteroides sp.]MCM1366722.1 diacylglycerol kinase family protein [Prevotella sp.]MCM1437264.1 diacylglycerol kinase family protein [Prevotella sp.]